MKKNFRTALSLTLVLSLGLFGCSKDPETGIDNGNGNGNGTGEPAVVSLRIHNAGAPVAKAAEADEHDASTEESTFASTVQVYVFKEDGTLEHSNSYTLDADDKTGEFTITTGTKYFYVFSDPAGVIDFSGAPVTNVKAFEKYMLDETKTAVETAQGLETADGTNFVNSTLWGEQCTVSDTKTEFDVYVGRMVAKVAMTKFSNENKLTTTMKGTFSAPKWRVGSVPVKTHLVGQYAGTIVPPAKNHGQVTSAVHSEGPGTEVSPNPLFANYATYLTADEENVSVYVNENTSEKMTVSGEPSTTGKLYYGNTTYIRFKAVYTPHEDEIAQAGNYTKKSTTWTSASTSGTFYTGNIDGTVYIFDGDPRTAHDGVTEIDPDNVPDSDDEYILLLLCSNK